MIRVGLMGFGRIGRNLFRLLYRRDDIRLVAISDVADHAGLEYLLRYDTLLGRFPDPVSLKSEHLYAAGRRFKMLSGAEPGDVDWGELGVDTVIEATAQYRSTEYMRAHLAAGAKHVILCAPPTDEPDITVVMGVNDHELNADHAIISNASATVHCAAPIIKILLRAFGIESLFLNTVHAYTSAQRLADVPADELRLSRAAIENIIPTHTHAGRMLMKLFPELDGRVDSLAMNVPVPNGSLVDMVCFTRESVDVEAVNEVVRTAVQADYARYVDYTTDPIVSSDVKASPYSSIFDSLATTALGNNVVKCIAWYDNGWGYAHRAIELVERLANMRDASMNEGDA